MPPATMRRISRRSPIRRRDASRLLGALALAAGPGSALMAAQAQTTPTPASAPAAAATAPTKAVDELVVTGLRGQKRTVLDSPSPIDVVSAHQLRETGKTGLREVLNAVVPSFNLPGINGGGTSWTVRAYTIRGLTGDEALFLVNGKRRHTTALINNLARVGNGGTPVDVDLIPIAAIDHIEVLRDGAAAQYGSDAIAGVVNIILKSGAGGGRSDTTLGAFYKGDGLTPHEAADIGLALPREGFLHLSLDAKVSDSASRADPSTATFFGKPGAPFGSDPRDLTLDRHRFGDSYGPGQESLVSGAFNLEQPIADKTSLYAFGTVADRNSRKNTGSFLPNNKNSLPEVYPDGFNALRRIYETDWQVAGGVRSTVAGWALDLGTTLARDYAYLGAEGTLNASLGPTSPTGFHLSTQIYQTAVTTLDLTRPVNIGLRAPLTVSVGLEHRYEEYDIKAGDPASYIVGGYVIPTGPYAGQRPNPGLASYTGTAPQDAGRISRNNEAAYVDLSLEPLRNVYLGAAGRVEHYTGGPGDTASGKFTGRWEFLPHYAVRATVSNGFRAPSLAQDIFASSTINGLTCPTSGVLRGVPCIAGQFVTLPTKFLPVGTAAAQALGAETLRPETSMNYSAGLTAEPWGGVRLSVDLYRIEIDDRILATGAINLLGSDLGRSPALEALAPRFPNGFVAQYFTNAAATRTQGIDVTAEKGFSIGDFGRLNLTLGYTYNETKITKLKATPAALTSIGRDFVLFDRQKQADLTIATPKDKLLLGADWSWRKLRTSLRLTRYGRYIEVNSAVDPRLDRTYGAKWSTDLDIAYAIRPGTELAVGANNLFDVYPDSIGVVDAQTGSGRYGQFSPIGITGGFYYARISQTF